MNYLVVLNNGKNPTDFCDNFIRDLGNVGLPIKSMSTGQIGFEYDPGRQLTENEREIIEGFSYIARVNLLLPEKS